MVNGLVTDTLGQAEAVGFLRDVLAQCDERADAVLLEVAAKVCGPLVLIPEFMKRAGVQMWWRSSLRGPVAVVTRSGTGPYHWALLDPAARRVAGVCTGELLELENADAMVCHYLKKAGWTCMRGA